MQGRGRHLSAKQADFANRRAHELRIEDHVHARVCNMLDTPFKTGQAAASWNNESSMYVDLHDLFAEHSRILEVGGRYVTITGCWNPRYGQPSKWVSQINAHFECNIHSRREYLRAMADNRLVPQAIVDLTPDDPALLGAAGHVFSGHGHRRGVHQLLQGRLLPVPPDRSRPRLTDRRPKGPGPSADGPGPFGAAARTAPFPPACRRPPG